MTDDHPPQSSPEWDNPDLCPFCGTALSDGGVGFIDHIEEAPTCKERFEDWREAIRDDIGGEWGG
jgi:hypothetical protein